MSQTPLASFMRVVGASQTKEKQHLLLRTLPFQGRHVLPFFLLHYFSSLPVFVQLHLKPSDLIAISAAFLTEVSVQMPFY